MQVDNAEVNAIPAPSNEPALGEPGANQAAPPPYAKAPPSAVPAFEGRLRVRTQPSTAKTITFDVPAEGKGKRQAKNVSRLSVL